MNRVATPSSSQSSQLDRASETLNSLGSMLWLKITLAQRLLNTAAQQFWTSTDVPKLFSSFLLELYSLVSCSVPLMRAAHERALELGSADPLASITAGYLQEHIEEETHHDEWLLDDLVASGMDRAKVANRWAGAAVASLVGAQYFWIRHAHPASIFGYLAAIEGNPPVPEHLDEIQVLTGYPPETFRCLRQHAADDIEHLKELHNTIISLPLNRQQEALIASSAYATVEGLIRIFEELKARAAPSRS